MYRGHPVLWLLHQIIDLLFFVVIVGVVLSWLVAFDVVNLRNRFVRGVFDVTNAILNPMLRPIRRLLPSFGGLDLSPLVLMLALGFAGQVFDWIWIHLQIPV